MTKIEETENVFFALGTALKAEGFKAIRFYRIRTRRQLFSVVGREDLRREEADDTMYSIEAVYEGNRCRIYTNHLEETENVIWMLQKTAKVYGEASGRAVCYISREWEQKTFCWDEPHMITETLRQVRKMAEESRMITHVSRCTYEQVCRDIQMVDEEMHMICDRDGYHCFTFGVVAEANGSRASTTDCIYVSHLSGMDVTSCVRRVIREAKASVGGGKLPSGRYPLILGGKVAAELLDAYLGAFFAGNLQKDESPLCGKENMQIAAPGLWLREVPGWSRGKSLRTVDDEGNAVTEKDLIRDGVFCQPLYNEETAKKAGVESTGNGFHPGIREDVQTGVTTLVLGMEEKNITTRNCLEEAMGEGLLITHVDGVFAGTDARTGKFSLIAGRRRIRAGKEAEPFREVTISGDFFEVLRQVRQVGDEVFVTGAAAASVLVPDLMTGELTVSGT